MLLFILGLMVGSCLGVFLIAMVATSKEADETVFRIMAEKERVAQECLMGTQEPIL
jgi:hypothetical protein